jgi:hypothetical protein
MAATTSGPLGPEPIDRSARLIAGLLGAGAVGLAGLGASMYLAPEPTVAGLALVGIGVPAAWVLATYPELGLVLFSFLTTGLLPRTVVSWSFGGHRFDAADLTVAALIMLLLARAATGDRRLELRWSIAGPLLVFAALACLAGAVALFWRGVAPELVSGELRPAVYAVGCALAGSLLWRRPQLLRLVGGLFLVADMTAAIIVVQQFFGGAALLLPGMSAGGWQITMAEGSAALFGGVRIVPPGHVLVMLLSIVAFCAMLSPAASSAVRWVCAFQFGFLNLALLLTYTRAQWIASGIAVCLACILMPAAGRRRLAPLVMSGLVGLAMVLGLAASGLLPTDTDRAFAALSVRISSIATPDETLGTDSLQWRVFETGAAFEAITARPWLGVGLGNDYREVTLLGGEASGARWLLGGDARLTRFIHNSYLAVAAKAGLPTLAVLAWFAIALLVVGARAYLKAPEGLPRAVALGVVCSFLGLLEWAVFEPHFMLPASMATVGLMVAVLGTFDRPSPAATG